MKISIQQEQKALSDYHRFLEDEFGSVLAKSACVSKTKSFGSVAIVVWGVFMAEASHLLRDLSTYSVCELSERQRSLFSQARFCMEAVADLDCMAKDSSQIRKFYAGAKDYKKALSIMREEGNTEEGAAKAAKALRNAGRLYPNTDERVKGAFPCQIQEYAILCYHTHLNAIGILQELRDSKEEAVSDLIYQCFDIVSSSLIKLATLTSGVECLGVSEPDIEKLVKRTKDAYDSFPKR